MSQPRSYLFDFLPNAAHLSDMDHSTMPSLHASEAAGSGSTINTDTSDIKHWRSIVTLVVFVFTNIIVLFPFHVPFYLPKILYKGFQSGLLHLRITSPPEPDTLITISREASRRPSVVSTRSPRRVASKSTGCRTHFVRLRFPMNFVTAPIIADLFLLAILAIGKKEVHDGIIGVQNVVPYDVMVFFISLAYIAISIDASGLIRYLALKVLLWGGQVGHKLFFYLYVFFFALGSFIGNDPIILSGTAFLAYTTRISSNIVHPRAWIHTQFAIANIASAVLVSSNPTNLVLAGAFQIKFIEYTANMIVPIFVTVILLFPWLLYVVFNNEQLIPETIEMHQLSEEAKARKPVNPNIPHARGNAEEEEKNQAGDEKTQLLSLEEIMNPFLDKAGAAFGALIMAATLITLLVLNAVSTDKGGHPVFWVTLPAAVVMFLWDAVFGWIHRHESRDAARKGRDEIQRARFERAIRAEEDPVTYGIGEHMQTVDQILDPAQSGHLRMRSESFNASAIPFRRSSTLVVSETEDVQMTVLSPQAQQQSLSHLRDKLSNNAVKGAATSVQSNEQGVIGISQVPPPSSSHGALGLSTPEKLDEVESREARIQRQVDEAIRQHEHLKHLEAAGRKATLASLAADGYLWCQETCPTATAVVTLLPFALIPFAFAMFILVQALVTKGWVPVFAYGWDHWVNSTGTVGAIAGMGFLSVILCNFAGTNIGTTILLSRVIQTWLAVHDPAHDAGPITNRTFWATVYSMALGVNYGAFSTAFSASLAGLLWRDILARKHIHVRSLDFARVNLPIIAIAMSVGCAVLIGQVYLTRDKQPYGA